MTCAAGNSHWLELGEVYPPALEKMKQVRDEVEKRIRDEEQVRVRFEDFHEFVAFNRTLREEQRTAATFKWLDETDAEDAKRLFIVAQPALIKQKAYDLFAVAISNDVALSDSADKGNDGVTHILLPSRWCETLGVR